MKAADERLVEDVCRGYLVTELPGRVRGALCLFDDTAYAHGITKTWRPWLAAGAAIHGIGSLTNDRRNPPARIAAHAAILPDEPAWGRRVLQLTLEHLRSGTVAASGRTRGASPVQAARRMVAARLAELVRGVGEAPPPLLAASDTLAQAGIKVLQRQFDQFASREYGLPLQDDPEFVHEMRVATRRMRAAMRVFGDGLGTWAVRAKGRLSVIADDLGVVRDADVFRLFLQRYVQACPSAHRDLVQAMIRCEWNRRRRGVAALLADVRSAAHRRFVARFRKQLADHLAERAADDSPAAERLQSAAPRLMRRKLKRVLKYDRPLGRYSSAELHALRIACKRLRYSAEFLSEIYPQGLDGVVRLGVSMQSLLGDVHDADVYHARVSAYARRRRASLGAGGPAAIKALHGHLDQWREQELREAEKVWKRARSKSGRHSLKAAIKLK